MIQNLYLDVKHHMSKRDEKSAFNAIHSWWQVPNLVNATASETEETLQKSTYDEEKKAWNWEKYLSHHVKYHYMQEPWGIWLQMPRQRDKNSSPVEWH